MPNLRLLDQGIINYLDVSDSPQKCDDYLTKLMVQLEELEGKFVEFDEFIEKLAEKREEVYTAFETRKKQLVESLNNRTTSLQRTADRILDGIQNRSKTFKEVNEINGFFASDLMVDKIRDIISQLTELEDTNKANSVQTRLKTLKEEAIRQLRDKQDLYVAGANIIKLGRHQFSVNVQPLDLTIVQKDGKMFFHLTGTEFYQEITDESFLDTKEVWTQSVISENNEVYRSEYLAYQLFKENNLAELNEEELKEMVKKAAATRYQEGYTKGIHDEDAYSILKALIELAAGIDLLHYSPDTRSFAHLMWEKYLPNETKERLQQQLESASAILEVFPDTHEFDYLIGEIEKAIKAKLRGPAGR